MKHIDYYLDVIQQNKTESTGGGTGGITPSGTKEISIVQNGESTEDVTRYASAHIVVDVPMPEPPTGVKEISVTENGVSTHDVSAFAQAEVTVAVPEPAGEKQITTNGKHDVKAFASVDVNVPSEGITPTGTKEITSNGTHDVTQYAQAKVNVPIPAEPAGTKDITENGVHDIKAFANVNVQVPVGVNPQGTKEISVTENGEKTEDVTNFKSVHIVTNVQSSGGGSGVPISILDRSVEALTDESIVKIGKYGMARCDSLKSLSLQNCRTVEDYGLAYCNKLENVELPICSTLGLSAFEAYTGSGALSPVLKSITLPRAMEIPKYCFQGQSNLETVKCVQCSAIRNRAFHNSSGSKLKTIDIRGGLWFEIWCDYVPGPTNIILRRDDKVTTAGQLDLPKICTIYVPDNLVEQYKTATNWSRHADKIKPLSEYVEEV